MGACGGGGRTPAGSARRPEICPGFSAGFLFCFCFILLGYLRKIDHWSILGKGMSAYNDFLLDHLRKIDHGSIVGRGMSV